MENVWIFMYGYFFGFRQISNNDVVLLLSSSRSHYKPTGRYKIQQLHFRQISNNNVTLHVRVGAKLADGVF